MASLKLCSIAGCGKPGSQRGWCGAHYQRWRRTGDPLGSIPRRKPPEYCVVAGCEKRSATAGLCCSHYKRRCRHGNPLAGRTPNGAPYKWIVAHVADQREECLIWPFGGAHEDRSYGSATVPGERQDSSARVMCRLAHGAPPPGKSLVRHICGKGHEGCVNPRHLKWGTYKENCADMVLHGTRLIGERVNGAKLTRFDVAEIRASKGREAQRRTAKRFGISQANVSMIQSGQRWTCLG